MSENSEITDLLGLGSIAIERRKRSDRRATVVIPLLNHEEFIEHLLLSLVYQWRDDLSLLVIDNGSRDRSFSVAQSMLSRYPYVHSTLARKITKSPIQMISTVLGMVTTPIIIQADSDDVALPGRLDGILRCFNEDAGCRLVTSNAMKISAEGVPLGLTDTLTGDTVFGNASTYAPSRGEWTWLGATAAYHRDVFEAFPPLDAALIPPTLDLLLPFRAVLLGTHHYLSKPLVGWRQHRANSHRTLGALRQDIAQDEAMNSVDLAIALQKLKDAKHFHSSLKISVPENERSSLVSRCEESIFQICEEWAKSRSSIGWKILPSNRKDQCHYVSDIPPVQTLTRDSRFGFDKYSVGAASIQAWSGFHEAEEWGVWTQRHALLCFHIPDLSIQGVIFKITTNLLPRSEIHVMIDRREWQIIELSDSTTEFIIPLPRTDEASSVFPLLLSVPDAAVPAESNQNAEDHRMLGIGLIWIEAV